MVRAQRPIHTYAQTAPKTREAQLSGRISRAHGLPATLLRCLYAAGTQNALQRQGAHARVTARIRHPPTLPPTRVPQLVPSETQKLLPPQITFQSADHVLLCSRAMSSSVVGGFTQDRESLRYLRLFAFRTWCAGRATGVGNVYRLSPRSWEWGVPHVT
eukprot:gene17024-biopygen8298